MERGVERGKLEGKLETARIIIQDFHLSVEETAQKFGLSIEVLKTYLKQ